MHRRSCFSGILLRLTLFVEYFTAFDIMFEQHFTAFDVICSVFYCV